MLKGLPFKSRAVQCNKEGGQLAAQARKSLLPLAAGTPRAPETLDLGRLLWSRAQVGNTACLCAAQKGVRKGAGSFTRRTHLGGRQVGGGTRLLRVQSEWAVPGIPLGKGGQRGGSVFSISDRMPGGSFSTPEAAHRGLGLGLQPEFDFFFLLF